MGQLTFIQATLGTYCKGGPGHFCCCRPFSGGQAPQTSIVLGQGRMHVWETALLYETEDLDYIN